MKTFVKKSLEMMGAQIEELPDDTLRVETPEGTLSEALLGGGRRHLLSFSGESADGSDQRIVPGCQLLEKLKLELAGSGSIRHGVYPAKINFSRKDVKTKYNLFAGHLVSYSVRSSWKVIVRCHAKILLTGNEFIEDIVAIDVSPGDPPKLVEKKSDLASEASWVEKPPLKRYELQKLMEEALVFAKMLAVENAEDLQANHLKDLYKSVKRLRSYYRQMKAERAKKGDAEAAETYEAEYQYRKAEEMHYARTRARVKIIAIETFSFPVKKICLQLERNGETREVSTTVNLFNTKIVAPVQCNICNCQTDTVGISESMTVVCSNCHASCDICKAEIVGKDIKTKSACSTCGRQVCPDHSERCGVCMALMCRDHVHRCRQGCLACKKCLRSCPDCGDTIVWCKNHTLVNSRGDATCRNHAVKCIDCGEYYAAKQTDTCSTCGRIICLNCQRSCTACNCLLCYNHIRKGKCATCHTELERQELQTQMRLFRRDLAQQLKARKR
jgi:hypothetical protein